jgi:hypothetical protein
MIIKINLALPANTLSVSCQTEAGEVFCSQYNADGLSARLPQNYAVHTDNMLANCTRR